MKALFSYFLACQLIVTPLAAVAEKNTPPPALALPNQFLDWNQFAALKPEIRAVYLDYLLFVSAVAQETQYPDEQILFDPGLSASMDIKNWLQEVFAGNEAHANPILAGAMRVTVGCLTALKACFTFSRQAAAKMAQVWTKFRQSKTANLAIESSVGKAKQIGYKPQGYEPIASSRSLVPVETIEGELVKQGTQVAKITPAAEAAAEKGGWFGPIAGAAAGMAGEKAVAKAIEDYQKSKSVGTGANLDASPKDQSPSQVGSANTNELVPSYKREKGAVCIFGGYSTSYAIDKVGGCKPPKEAVNSRDCKGTKKPSFKCNGFGLDQGDLQAAKKMCVTLKNGQGLSELTQNCLVKYLDLLHGKNAHTMSKDEYEKLLKQINQQLDASRTGQPSLRQYCGKDYQNTGNQSRQKRECEALHGLLASVEEYAPHTAETAAVTPAAPAPESKTPAKSAQ